MATEERKSQPINEDLFERFVAQVPNQVDARWHDDFETGMSYVIVEVTSTRELLGVFNAIDRHFDLAKGHRVSVEYLEEETEMEQREYFEAFYRYQVNIWQRGI